MKGKSNGFKGTAGVPGQQLILAYCLEINLLIFTELRKRRVRKDQQKMNKKVGGAEKPLEIWCFLHTAARYLLAL